eukprot:3940479-Rhodomonas_salina.2
MSYTMSRIHGSVSISGQRANRARWFAKVLSPERIESASGTGLNWVYSLRASPETGAATG